MNFKMYFTPFTTFPLITMPDIVQVKAVMTPSRYVTGGGGLDGELYQAWQIDIDVDTFVAEGRGKHSFLSMHREHRGPPAPPSTGQRRQVGFLVRTYKPEEATSERILSWFSDLADEAIDMHVSVDQTNPEHTDKVGNLLRKLISNGFNVKYAHRYKEDDMLRAYPGLLEPCKNCVRSDNTHRFALGYHIQAIGLWLQELAEKSQTYDHVWVFEDDVGYSGPKLSSFLSSFSKDDSDMIGGSSFEVASPAWWPNEPTSLFRARVPPEKRLAVSEHAQRFSARLLAELDDWSVAGAIDWSEAMPGTVCRFKNMTCRPFTRSETGQPYSYDGRITTPEEWSAIVTHDALSNTGKLYHALKF